MHKISRRCPNCQQPLEELCQLGQDPPIVAMHHDVSDCIRALVKRVENLEYELLAKKLPEALTRTSEPGPPSDSIPVIMPNFKR